MLRRKSDSQRFVARPSVTVDSDTLQAVLIELFAIALLRSTEDALDLLRAARPLLDLIRQCHAVDQEEPVPCEELVLDAFLGVRGGLA
jgi:hypothetical protein